SIKSAASTVAYDLVTFYSGNDTGNVAGNLPSPYYWWEAGGFFGSLINYWAYTGDDTYNSITVQALVHQAGSDGNFMPANQTLDEGNDDQCFWAISAMMAAERNFTNPPSSDPGWLATVQAVFNEQTTRWDASTCGGGLRWQIFTWNAGYNYKNSIANGCFFNIAARLARYTGNATYANWATRAWDWTESVGLIGSSYQIYDGSSDTNNCSSVDNDRWTYNTGVYLLGAAVMYNYTSSLSTNESTNTSSIWKARVDGLLSSAAYFFSTNTSSENVMYERQCELIDDCDTDELSFKAYLSRWMAEAAQVAPYTYNTIMTYLRATAQAAVAQCEGGTTGTYCGFEWTTGTYDGTTGVGQQMSVLETVQGLLAGNVRGPYSASTGGTSKGNSAAGTGDDSDSTVTLTPITTADRVGAAILTAVVLGGIIFAVYIMVF
ncbi:Mannan endo-1-6-alpha-mannosidase DCW1, partial [Penicillium lagena]|uniref:Mannan endo-1-6-alpha-mannosidase DCW1 n=1 Tax=Penicillium lagena TaxID=94218 RepID=UPI00253FB306